jgi:hypothetical protein
MSNDRGWSRVQLCRAPLREIARPPIARGTAFSCSWRYHLLSRRPDRSSRQHRAGRKGVAGRWIGFLANHRKGRGPDASMRVPDVPPTDSGYVSLGLFYQFTGANVNGSGTRLHRFGNDSGVFMRVYRQFGGVVEGTYGFFTDWIPSGAWPYPGKGNYPIGRCPARCRSVG